MPPPSTELDDNASVASNMTSAHHMLNSRSLSVVSDISSFIERASSGPSQQLPSRTHKRHTRQESVDTVSREISEAQERNLRLRQENKRKQIELEFLLEQKKQRELDRLLEEARRD
jgi:uncharacterized membrane protein YhiD involved in acid resistance